MTVWRLLLFIKNDFLTSFCCVVVVGSSSPKNHYISESVSLWLGIKDILREFNLCVVLCMVLAFQNKSSIMNMSMISTTNHFLANRFQCVSSENTVRKIRQRMIVQLLLLLCMYGPIAAMGSCSIAPFGTAVITGDCVLSNQIIVIGTLNVTGRVGAAAHDRTEPP